MKTARSRSPMFNERSKQIYTYSGTRHILEKYNITVRKNYGQNFLIDPHVLGKIISSSGVSKEHLVIEIGPGIGGLTQALAECAGKVVTVEIDDRLVPVLRDIFVEYDNVEIIHGDILKTDIGQIIASNNGLKAMVVANLPYYITTPIIMGLLESRLPLECITVMVQKEVADRMRAEPGTKDYGALTLAVRYYADAFLAANVPPNSFIPRPKVASAVLRLTPLTPPNQRVQDEKLLFGIIKAAFGQRRKTLLNCLFNSGEWEMNKDELSTALHDCGFSENVRGEELSLEDFFRLTEWMASRQL